MKTDRADAFASHTRKMPGGCIEWTYTLNGDGYGVFYFQEKLMLAHRIAWELAHGAIPVGLCVCHHCDNPSCVNPEHLFLGTRAENLADMTRKGRRASTPVFYGANHPRARFTEETVRLCRQGFARGATLREMAEQFDVSIDTVWKIKNGKRWSHVV